MITILAKQIANHRARRLKAKRSMANVMVIRSAESPMFVGLRKIKRLPGESEESAAERRRKAFESVIANSR